ncbi:MAG: hypothetical protein AB7T59_15505 [Hyphomonadaceae bacterium]
MRMIAAMALVCGLGLSSPAVAQPVPDSIRSSALTRAQEHELNRRLGLLHDRLGTLASQTQLRETAVRNIAIEIFGAQPDLDFETYTGLIDSGARQLRDYIGAARQRTDADPQIAAIRDRAIAAAEDGRLADARAIYQELIEANRVARVAARRAEDLADAADIAEAARLALISADTREAARLFSDAADTAPTGTRVRWLYRVMQSQSITLAAVFASGDAHNMDFGAHASEADLAEAIRILRAAEADAPADWRWLFEELEEANEIDAELYFAIAGSQAVAELYQPPTASSETSP